MSQSYIKHMSRPRLVQVRFGYPAIRVSNATPLVVLAAPRSNQIILPDQAILDFDAGTAYADTLIYTLGWGGGSAAGVFAAVQSVDAVQLLAPTTVYGATTAPTALVGNAGRSITLTAAADRASGTGTITFTLIYRIYNIGG